MNDNEGIMYVKNDVGPGIGPGKDNPHSLKTKETSVYRVTGMDQIYDIINCGYVRPKEYGSRQKRVGAKVYWSYGSSSLCYQDKRPVIEAARDKVQNQQIGAISLDDLIGIWMYDDQQNKYINNLEYVKNAYNEIHQQDVSIDEKSR